MDIEEGNKALDNFEIKQAERSQKVKDLIVSMNRHYKEIDLDEERIRIRRYMPKKQRLELLKLSRALEESTPENMDAVEKRVYSIVAAMCIDEPFTSEDTWEHLDNETGCIQDVLVKIAEASMRTDKELKSFR